MKKLFLLFGIAFLSLGISSAQFFSYGIKGGVNYSKLQFDDISNISTSGMDYNLLEDNAFQSFHFGIMTRLNIMNMYIQPELYFNTSGGKVLVQELDASGGVTVENIKQVKFSKIDLPLLLGFKIGPMRINAGPVASAVLSEKNEITEVIPELESLSKVFTIGYQAGVGIDILKFLTLDYRYEGGLSKWGEKLTVGGNDYPFDSRANMHLLSLGILF
ncbi:MAG: PorT family protein [Bacteroidales bacterium]|nr:PorT family protein [Bacteroidales bacterium]MCF8391945.1 PorT family protein [Bacteroidales bacterium]